MPYKYLTKPWGIQKPPLGTPLNSGHPLAKGLIAALSMNEGGGTSVYDNSGNNNKGTWHGTGTHWLPGKFGIGTNFNGTNDYISLSSKVITAGSFSISCWFNYTGSTISALYTQGANIAVYIRPDSSNRLEVVVDGANGDFSANNSISANTWYHIVLTYDGTNVRVYLNGVLKIGPQARTASYTASFTEIARYNQNTYNAESIDNMLFYNCALSQAEIQWLYREPFAMFTPPALGLRQSPTAATSTPGTIVPTSYFFTRTWKVM